MLYSIKFNFREQIIYANLKRDDLYTIIQTVIYQNRNIKVSKNVIDNLISRPNRASKYLREVISITKKKNNEI